jgi:hypothetical protein
MMFKQQYIISHTEDNAVDLHSMGYSPLTLTMMAREKHINPVTNMSLCHYTEEDFFLSITQAKRQIYAQFYLHRTLQKITVSCH